MATTDNVATSTSFYDRPGTEKDIIPIGPGIPMGFERVSNVSVGIGGVYGSWGDSYNNENLPAFIEARLGRAMLPEERLSLADLGFISRQHIVQLSHEDNAKVEIEVGTRFLKEALKACNWQAAEVEGVLIGLSAPLSDDYLQIICRNAGIPDSALKVVIHKACDSSTSGLHLALNPALPENVQLEKNIAEQLYGKKVLVGGIEGLSRFVDSSPDTNALQLFGNAAGVIGVIPGKTMKFLAGKSHEVYDEEGVLQVLMYYPHNPQKVDGSNVDVTQTSPTHIRVAGLMHEPASGDSIAMAGPMGMVKLFVRTGVQLVREVYAMYQAKLAELGMEGKAPAVAIVHHANYKINKLKEKHLSNEGIVLPMPWLVNDFGNVSAASNMIAFLRYLPQMKPQDHILVDGFGAGTYYDALVVELGG